MRLRFTKLIGAGNDFVVLDGTSAPIELSREQLKQLGDRRIGVAADQILEFERSSTPGRALPLYSIYNGASGDEVEHCGNGARCFVRCVHGRGLTDKTGPSVSQPSPAQPRAMADAAIFQRAVLACMDGRGYTLP